MQRKILKNVPTLMEVIISRGRKAESRIMFILRGPGIIYASAWTLQTHFHSNSFPLCTSPLRLIALGVHPVKSVAAGGRPCAEHFECTILLTPQNKPVRCIISVLQMKKHRLREVQEYAWKWQWINGSIGTERQICLPPIISPLWFQA